jgi:hypothetical protein
MFGKYQKNALATVDGLQMLLSERHITPNANAFEKAFYALREIIDEIWFTEETNKLEGEKKSFLIAEVRKQKLKIARVASKIYPLGRCYEITKIVFNYLQEIELHDDSSPFYPLHQFVKEGGVFKVIWGEVRHEVFQTSMQMGNWYFDAANDTVILTKPKVLKFTFDSNVCEFFDVKSVHQYVAIKRTYHESQIFINNLFPVLSSYFPLIAVSKDNISIDDSRHIADIMVQTDFSFLREHSLPSLSNEECDKIRQKIFQNRSMSALLPLLNSSPQDFVNYSCHEIYRVVKQINFVLKFK